MVKTMRKNSIVFAMANPTPEIMPDVAKKAGVKIMGTGRSDFPNQINNALVFPGMFRGALDAKAKQITDQMKIAAVNAIANLIKPNELSANYVIPSVLDKRVAPAIAKAVAKASR
jgi:malate dehydrogenase (oxaloacetate-decarboxylating)